MMNCASDCIKDGVLTLPPTSVSYFNPAYGNSIPKESYHSSPSPASSGSRFSPAVLFVIVILAVIFFISGLLHLLIRFFIKKPPSSSSSSRSNRYPDLSGPDALQRQLQQLFHLHDSGLDQAFIDALPVFLYKEIMGIKEPFDCSVCLCEFCEEDKLRLLPMCSHAFHLHCIDTWLLSNSTCPLCRGSLFCPGFALESPIFEISGREDDGFLNEGEDGFMACQKPTEDIVVKKQVMPVRLGKFRNLNNGCEGKDTEGETSSSNIHARRCYSLGSYQYIVGDANLHVALNQQEHGENRVRLTRRSSQENSSAEFDLEGKKISNVCKDESFSVSKIWLWSSKGKVPSYSNTHGSGLIG